MTQEICIIGCGPAGLLAAHAAVRAGYTPVIISAKAEPSPTAKAVFVHRAIPEMTSTEPDSYITMRKLGDGDGYAAKVYGDPEHPCSWDKFAVGGFPAWKLETMYRRLWASYRGAIREAVVTPTALGDIARGYPYVINTAPARDLCLRPEDHTFPVRETLVTPHAPLPVVPNEMVYNGVPTVPWMRASDLFGVRSTEYPASAADVVPGLADRARPGIKVLPTTCNCHPQVVRAGRWGKWMPGVLLHHAFERVEAILGLDAEVER